MELNKSVFVEARQWFDKSGGNSYFSARVWVNGVFVRALPFQYGYGSQYEAETMRALVDVGVISEDFVSRPFWQLRELGFAAYAVMYEAKKADVVRFGKVA
jgi:hypothetical protein